MKRIFLSLLLSVVSGICFGQINGTTNPTLGSTHQYSYTGSAVYQYYTWSISPLLGTVNSTSRNGTIYYVSITWHTAGTTTLGFSAYGQAPMATRTITVSCPTASTPSATFNYPGNVCGNQTITYSGTPPAGITWYWQTSSGGVDQSNSTNTITISSSGYYYLRAKPNCSSTWSSAVSTNYRTVNPIPNQPTSANDSYYCAPTSLNLTACCAGGNEYIRWYDVPSGGSPISTWQTVNNTKSFYATVYNTVTTCESSRRQMTVYINTPPGTATPQSSPASVCGSGNITLSATGAAGGEEYRWYDAAAGGNIVSTTPYVDYTRTFYVSRYNPSTFCEGSRTGVTVTVNPLPVEGTISSNTNVICLGQSVTISSSGGVGTPYYWASTNGGSSWDVFSASYAGQSSFSFTPATAGTYRFHLRNQTSCGFCWEAGTGCPTYPYVDVEVRPIPNASASNQDICSGQTTSVSITNPNGVSGTTFSWTASATNVSGASSGSGSTISQALTNTTSSNGTVTYTITPSANGCNGSAINVTVTVKPIPTAAASNQSVCTGQATSIALSNPNGVSGTTYSWTASASGVTGASNGSGSSIVQTLSSTSGGTVTYTVTPSANGCAGTPINVVATVVTVASPTVSGNSRFTPGPVTLTGSGAPGGGNYNWYNSSDVYQSQGSTFTTGTVSATTSNYMYVRAVNSMGCLSPPYAITINIFANPTITAPQTTVVREAPVTLTATAGFDTYTWRNPSNAVVGSGQTYNATMPGTYTVTVTKSGATSSAVPFTLVAPLAGQNLNYIVTNQVLLPNITNTADVPHLAAEKVTQSVTYFDGLGRPMQSVAAQASPLKGDLVTPVKYDVYGRQFRDYLPYVSENNGRFKSSDLTNQASYYNPATVYLNKIKTDANPWAEKVFEASPLNRVLQQGAPGSVYQPNAGSPSTAKSVKLEYLTNTDGTGANQEKVKIFTLTTVTLNGKTEYLLNSTTSYTSNMLYVNVTKDEENRQVREYTDKQGKVVLKKVQESTTGNIHLDNEWVQTYYIYDEFDRLRFVVQPKFIFRNSIYVGLGNNQDKKNMLDSLTFEYRYDSRGRMIYKRVPGAKEVEMVYDQWDRLVLSQDGNQRAAGKWSFTKYDVLNRPIITGEYTHANNQAQMQTAVNAITNRFETTASGNGVGYSLNQTYPTATTINDIYTITYYDDYTFKTNLSLGTAYDAVIPSGFTGAVHNRVKNLVTGSKVRVLNSSPVQWLVTASYYDDRYRLLQAVADDHLNNKNRTTNEYYGITPWITKSLLAHGSAMTVLSETTYDHMGRVKEMWQTMDGQTANRTLVASHQYNELGQLVVKNIHSTNSGTTFLQYNDYRYNIRGWLTHINNSTLTADALINDNDPANDLFGMELKYNDVVNINGTNTTAQYNGNISAIQWKTSNLVDAATEKIYGFKYDPLNRLTDATYATKNGSSWNANVNLFDENMAYDKNGNIKTLKRKSLVNSTNNALIDDLVYKYKGNQLDAVKDNALDTYNDYGFDDKAPLLTDGEYTYDGNGNMKDDQNKALVAPGGGVKYNHLNLPVEVKWAQDTYQQQKIVYTYDAAGSKLRKIAYNNAGTEISRTDYVGGIQYENSTLKFMSTGEGRVVKDGSSWNYEYFHKDHLGNTRVVYGYQKQVDVYKATMETPMATKEESQFYNIATRRVTLFNRTPASIDVITPDKSAETNGNLNKAVGPAKMLQVSSGDRVQLEVFARYQTGTGGNTTLISNLASAVTGTFALTAGEAAHTAITNSVPAQAATISPGSGVPKAYLFYILFNSSYVYQQFGYVSVNSTAQVGHQQMYLDITIPTGGYLYTYVINESNVSSAVSVYFDDFTVVHTRNTNTLQVVQTNDYYPFGLQIAAQSYQKQTALDNDYLFNGPSEFQDEFNLGFIQTNFRFFSPELGRFWGIDALASMFPSISPSAYSFNSPVKFNDPTGLNPECPECPQGVRVLDEVVITASRIESHTDYTALLNSLNPLDRAVGSKYKRDGYLATARYVHDNKTIHFGRQADKTQWAKDFDHVFGSAVTYGVGGMLVVSVGAPYLITSESVSAVSSLTSSLKTAVMRQFVGYNLREAAFNATSEAISQGMSGGNLDYADIVAAGAFGFNSYGSGMVGALVNFDENGLSTAFGNPANGISDLSFNTTAALLGESLIDSNKGLGIGTSSTLKLGIDYGLNFINNQINKSIENHNKK